MLRPEDIQVHVSTTGDGIVARRVDQFRREIPNTHRWEIAFPADQRVTWADIVAAFDAPAVDPQPKED